MPKPLSIILYIENIRSLHNLGALFRTADAVGAEKIILSPLCATPPRTEISKTALGAELSVPWEQPAEPLATLRDLQRTGYQIIALEQTPTSSDLYTTDVRPSMVLVVGHEREGVSKEILDLCELHLEIPMRGTSAHSLNVSTATGIALYELSRRLCYDGATIG
ncbi:MAG: TrmH family RNA methyltransferase [bacterium]